MPRTTSLTLTESAVVGLFFIQRYRFLTIDQFARVADLNRSTAGDQLRFLEKHKLLHFFGNTGLPGGKTPKVYYLTRKGFEILATESDIPQELLGSYREIKVEATWSPYMYHRLRTVDMLISTECAVRTRPHLAMVKTFLEYCRRKRGNFFVRETTDYVDKGETAENKIIPDAAFILENIHAQRRALFFLELDMATETIISSLTRSNKFTLHHKFTQYDRYLKSLRYQETYKEYGDFRSFTLLFVTMNETRIEHIRRELRHLPEELGAHYRLTTFAAAMGDFLSAIWKSRSLSDMKCYPLIREGVAVAG